jgi:hypothetical protein
MKYEVGCLVVGDKKEECPVPHSALTTTAAFLDTLKYLDYQKKQLRLFEIE